MKNNIFISTIFQDFFLFPLIISPNIQYFSFYSRVMFIVMLQKAIIS